MKVNFISINKGHDLYTILVREDNKVLFNFGDDNWIKFENMIKMGIKNQKYQNFIKNPNFQKNYKQTKKVIETSKDYQEITQKFIKDFKKDRGNRIVLTPAEMEVKDD